MTTELNELRRLAGLPITESIHEDDKYSHDTGDQVEKTVVGHVDDETNMIRKELYQMGKYCVELFRMMEQFPEGDYPHWWQSKITKASEYLSAAKHYMENEMAVDDVEHMLYPEDDYSDTGI